LRRPSPSETLGGGVIVDHQPKGRHKRFDGNVLRSLESLAQGSPADVLLEAALALNIASIKEVVAKSRLESANAQIALDELIQTGQLLLLEEGESKITGELLIITLLYWNDLKNRIANFIETHHKQFPLRRGIPREELKSKLKLSARIYNSVIAQLIKRNVLIDGNSWLANAGHEIRFNEAEQVKVTALMRKFEVNPYGGPSVKECQGEVGEEMVSALIELGELVAVSQDVIFRKIDYDEMVKNIRASLQQKRQITLAEVRDLFNTSRKYAQALLEHLDTIGITVRDGDFRKLRN
jgi:selenocysteine-specific elongation factor